MKKKSIVFVVVGVLMMFVAGCSNTNRTSDEEVAMATSEEIAVDEKTDVVEEKEPKIFINGQEWKAEEEISLGTYKLYVVEFDTRPGLDMNLYHFEDSEYKVASSMPIIYYLTKEHEDGDYSKIIEISAVAATDETDELIAISDEYMLFDTKDGKLAISFEEVQGEYDEETYPYEILVQREGGYHPHVRYEDLSAEQQAAFHNIREKETIEW